MSTRHSLAAPGPSPSRTGFPAGRHPGLIVRKPLAIGDRVRTLHAGRTSTGDMEEGSESWSEQAERAAQGGAA